MVGTEAKRAGRAWRGEVRNDAGSGSGPAEHSAQAAPSRAPAEEPRIAAAAAAVAGTAANGAGGEARMGEGAAGSATGWVGAVVGCPVGEPVVAMMAPVSGHPHPLMAHEHVAVGLDPECGGASPPAGGRRHACLPVEDSRVGGQRLDPRGPGLPEESPPQRPVPLGVKKCDAARPQHSSRELQGVFTRAGERGERWRVVFVGGGHARRASHTSDFGASPHRAPGRRSWPGKPCPGGAAELLRLRGGQLHEGELESRVETLTDAVAPRSLGGRGVKVGAKFVPDEPSEAVREFARVVGPNAPRDAKMHKPGQNTIPNFSDRFAVLEDAFRKQGKESNHVENRNRWRPQEKEEVHRNRLVEGHGRGQGDCGVTRVWAEPSASSARGNRFALRKSFPPPQVYPLSFAPSLRRA